MSEMPVRSTSIRISRGSAMRLKGLLHMKYKPSELAQELELSTDTLYRSYLPAGAPCEKDAEGNIWIIGDLFAKWLMEFSKTNRRKQPNMKLLPGQAYCVACQKGVTLIKPRIEKPNARGVANLIGKCPDCGRKVIRFCRASEWQG